MYRTGVILCLCGVLVTSSDAQFADSYNYFGYQHTDGRGIEPRSTVVVQTETIVMPYNRLASSQAGYVHGFRYQSDVENQPFRIQIWRRNQGIWQADGSWLNTYMTSTDADLNGLYNVVYTTDVIYSGSGVNTIYLQEAVQVQQDDFLGFSYLLQSPFYYDEISNCVTEYSYSRLRLTGYPVARTMYSFNASYPVTSCRTYPLGMLVEYTEESCTRLNLLSLNTEYTVTSHDGYNQNEVYDNFMDSCWVIHSFDENYYVTLTVDSADDFDLEYFTNCGYDSVSFSTKQGIDDAFVLDAVYCDVSEFPYSNEIFLPAPIVKLRFQTDYSVTGRGFRFKFRAVETDYTPTSATTTPAVGAAVGAASSDSSESCKEDKTRWEWRCLKKAEKILLIFIIILLVATVLLLIGCVIWYCFYRPRDQVSPNKPPPDGASDGVDGGAIVMASRADNTYAEYKTYGIPYQLEPPLVSARGQENAAYRETDGYDDDDDDSGNIYTYATVGY